MKNLKKLAFIASILFSAQFYAQNLKSGAVTYEMSMPGNSEVSAMGSNTIKISFNDKSVATQMNMMGGMMSIKTITADKKDTKNTVMLMEVMGKKYHITDADADGLSKNDVGSMKDAVSVTYDKKDKKEILGYKCYKAIVTMTSGEKSKFYITEAIAPQTNADDKVVLAGFPLEIEAGEGESQVILKATEFNKTLTENTFVVPEGYKKVTQAELQEELGGGF